MMEECNRKRRCRRSRRSCNGLPKRSSSFTDFVYHTVVMSLLIGVIYMMLDFHCTSCGERCNSTALQISKQIQHISDNLVVMTMNYKQLEKQICYLSEEFPKLEGQIELLESLAKGFTEPTWSYSHRTPLCPPLCHSQHSRHYFDGSTDCARNCTEKLSNTSCGKTLKVQCRH